MSENKSQMFRIYEMRDEMEKGISNVENVIKQQKELIEILDKNELSEDLKKFKKGLETQLQQYFDQLVTIQKRKDQLGKFIEWYEKYDDKDAVDVMLSELFSAMFGDKQ